MSEQAPMYNAGDLLTIIAALGVLITGVGAVIVNIIVALKTGTKLDQAAIKTTELVAQVKEVHTLTNSGLDGVKAELTLSNALNIQLREVIADLKEERSKTALATAFTSQPPLKANTPDEATADHLEEIEVNTAETAENTKQTEQSTKRTEETINEKLP